MLEGIPKLAPLTLCCKLWSVVCVLVSVTRIQALNQELSSVAAADGLPGLLLYQEHHHHHRHRPQHHRGHRSSHQHGNGKKVATATLDPTAHQIAPVIFHHKAHKIRTGYLKQEPPATLTTEVTGAQKMKELLDGYDPEEPPAPGSNGHVEYAIAFLANKLVEVDHIRQTMTLVGWVRQYWYDPRLSYEGASSLKPTMDGKSWDSKQDSLRVQPDAIWNPDIKLVNSLDFNSEELCDSVDAFVYDNSDSISVLVDGGQRSMKYNVFYSRPCVLVTKCDVDLQWYPFDANKCPLKFMPWHDGFLKMHIAEDYLETRVSLPEFAVRLGKSSVEIVEKYQFPQAEISFIIMRHGDYYVVNYICPVGLIVFLSWVSFFVPHAASDRLAYTLTLLLTLMAVNFITAEKRPATDVDMWLDEYQTVTMVLVVIATFYSVLTMRYQPEENWSDQAKQERREKLDKIEKIAQIIFPVTSVISVGFLFWELHMYSAKYLSLSDHLHSRPAMLVFVIMLSMSCILMYIMLRRVFVHQQSGESYKQAAELPLPPSTDRLAYQQQVPIQYLPPASQHAPVQQAPVVYQTSAPSSSPPPSYTPPVYVQQQEREAQVVYQTPGLSSPVYQSPPTSLSSSHMVVQQPHYPSGQYNIQ